MNFFTELKRRNVFRVGAAYLVGAWLLIEVADTVFPRLGLPEWTVTFVIAVAVLGFPLALFLAWAFELTPQGVKRTEDVTPGDSLTPGTGKRIDRLILIGALAVIAVLVVERVWFAQRSEPDAAPAAVYAETPAAARSIAVLAFDDLSPEGDQAYFAEGVAEELLNLLARIDGLKVAARTSSFRFKGTGADIAEIGQALNVETVLEGSVRKAGDQIRVTAQLINVGDGFHLWSHSYDRRLENIFAVQDEIATAIVGALRLELDIASATAGRTADTEAYEHYLRGRQLAREPSRAGLLRAIEQYERAIALDPNFAAAYAGIADAWVWLEDYGGVPGAEAFPKAEQAAKRALDLDPEAAEAHAAMAFVRDRYHHDKLGAVQAFERTLELNPNHVAAYNMYSDVLFDIGRLDRMLEVSRRAAELDPLSPFLHARYAGRMMSLGRLAEARAHLDRSLRQFPGNDYLIETLADLEVTEARLAEALGHYRAVHFSRPGDPYSAARIEEFERLSAALQLFLGDYQDVRSFIERQAEIAPAGRDWLCGTARSQFAQVLLEEGEAARAAALFEESLRTLEEMFDAGRGWADRWLEAAAIHALQGRHEEALQWLQRTFDAGFYVPGLLTRDRRFAALHDDPGFQEIVAQMDDAQAAQRARVEAGGIAAELDAMIAAGLGPAQPAGPAEASP